MSEGLVYIRPRRSGNSWSPIQAQFDMTTLFVRMIELEAEDARLHR